MTVHSPPPAAELRIDDLLARQVCERPECIFLRDTSRALSFAQVEEQVARLAGGLRRQGIAPGDRVALMLPNGVDFVLLWLACARLQALCVFVNPAYIGAMLDYVLDDAHPNALISHGSVVPNIATASAEVLGRLEWLCMIEPAAAASVEMHGTRRRVSYPELFDADAFAAMPAGGDPVQNCVIYTSGTTGPSKGVVLSTIAVLAGSRTFVALTELTARDILYTPLPLFHGLASRQGVLGCLIAGAEVVIGHRFSASRFWDEVRAADATVAHTMFNLPPMLKAQPPHPLEREHRLRALYNANHDAEFEDRFGVPLLEAYGLVETGITIYSPCSLRKPGSCGTLHRDWEAQIVDAAGNVLPDGETGELLLRPKRAHLFMSGYLNKPEATLDACRDFWFHTGDFLSRDPDGHFYFAGRQKERIRRRGENVSAWEIERIASGHPAVRLCAAIGYRAAVGDDDIRLVLTLKDGAIVTHASLAEWLAARMPPFMVPRYIEIVNTLPLTPTSKVRKSELIDSGFRGAVWDRERSVIVPPESVCATVSAGVGAALPDADGAIA